MSLPTIRQSCRRIGVSAALTGVIYYLIEIGIERQLLQPLIDFRSRLGDATLGMLDAFLSEADELLKQQRGRGGRPQPSSREIVPKAWAAARVTILHQAGMPLDEALAKVSKEIGISKETLKQLRKNINAGRSAKQLGPLYKAFVDSARPKKVQNPRG